MSRSYKKSSYCAHTTATSEKKDKQLWHRSFRANTRNRMVSTMRKDLNFEGFIDVQFREISSTWCMSKDGRCYTSLQEIKSCGPIEEQKRRWRSIYGK